MALAVAQVGGNITTSNAGAANSFTFDSSTTSGSLILWLVAANSISSPIASEFTDNKSNTQTVMDYIVLSVQEAVGVAYNNAGTRGASHQLTFDPTSGSASVNLGGIEITGFDTSTPFETACTGKANDTASPFDVAIASSVPSGGMAVYVCSIGGASGNAAVGNPTGYTVISSQGNANTDLAHYFGYKLSESGTPTVGCTWAGTVGSESPREMIIAVKAAAAAGKALPFPPNRVRRNLMRRY